MTCRTVGRDDSETLAAFDRRVRHLHSLARDGVCPECSGQMQTELAYDEDCPLDATLRAEYTCLHCHHDIRSPIGLALLDQFPVVSFYRDHGIDLGATPYWRLSWCVSDDHTTVDSPEPRRVRVSVSENDETLTVSVDQTLSVVGTNRADSGSATDTER